MILAQFGTDAKGLPAQKIGEKSLEIVQGPSRWDLVIRGLGDGESVTFGCRGLGEVELHITALGHGKQFSDKGDLLSQFWKFRGFPNPDYVSDFFSDIFPCRTYDRYRGQAIHHGCEILLSGTYSEKTRKGTLVLEEWHYRILK